MLTLITGSPGKGKTALAVQMMLEYSKDRPIFADGIKGLKIDHQPVPHVDEWVKVSTTATGAEEYEWIAFPPGSVIFLDEAQRYFRPRHPSKQPPAAVAGFETHRHAGIDFVILTQQPSFLDSHIRGLLDVHIHIQDGMLGRFSYTWFREGTPSSKADLKEASRKKYSPPKEVFDLYKSAELHTKQTRSKPILFYVGIISVIAFVVLVYRIINSVSSRNETVKTADGQPVKIPTNASAQWRVIGWMNGQQFRVVLSDGSRNRIIVPESFKISGQHLEVDLPEGGTASNWSGNSDRK